MGKPHPFITLDRRWRIFCARFAQAIYLPQVTAWLVRKIPASPLEGQEESND